MAENIVKDMATEEGSALEKFLEYRLRSLPFSSWNRIRLVRKQITKDNVIITTWKVVLAEKE